MTDIFPLVHADLDARDRQGRETYGRPCQTNDGRRTIVDIYEEMLDACVYLRKLIAEQDQAAKNRHWPGGWTRYTWTCCVCGHRFDNWHNYITHDH